MLESSSVSEYLQSVVLHSFGSFLNPMSFLSLGPLLAAFGLAFIVISWRLDKKARGRRVGPLKVLKALFPKRIFFHPSAKNDYKLFFINDGVLFFLTLSAIITPALFAEVFVQTFEALGITTGETESTLLSKIALTVLLVLAWDFGGTYAHYLKHKVPLLWEFHKVHHSAEVMTPITAMRRHPVDTLFGAMITTATLGTMLVIWTMVFGRAVEPFTIFGVFAGIYLWRLLGYNLRHSHVWISYGDFWNRIFISPAQHQVHHSTSPEHYDTNFGHIFSFWDSLFGTLYLPRHEERVKFGIEPDDMKEFETLRGLYFHPFVRCADAVRSKFRKQQPG